jgi:hypothetical protein
MNTGYLESPYSEPSRKELGMFSFQKPALRHFAVMKRAKISRYGHLWLVKDRRGLGLDQLLLVPSKRRVWPLLLSALSKHEASPVRLRNSRVAILIGSTDTKSVITALRETKNETVVLNAISGFEQGRSRLRTKPLLAIAGLAALVVGANLIPKSISTQAAVVESQPLERLAKVCEIELNQGEEILGSTKKLKRVSIKETEFVVASSQRLGGLLQLKLKRSCDGKYFRVDAWSDKTKVLLAKIY